MKFKYIVLIGLMAWGVVVSFLLYSLTQYVNLPTMHKSWSTHKCVKIETPGGVKPCDYPVKKYSVVWVR